MRRKNGEIVIVLNNRILKDKHYSIASMNSTAAYPIPSSNGTQVKSVN